MIALISLVRLAYVLPSRVYEWDFSHYYLSSRLLLDGRNPYSTLMNGGLPGSSFATSSEIPTATNPPLLLWLVAPLTLLQPRPAFWVWAAVQAASLGVILVLIRRLLSDRFSVRAWRFLCCGVIASQAVYYHFFFSQAQLLLAALVLAGYYWLRKGRCIMACLAVTAAGLIKLFPFILLPWFVWRGGGSGGARVARAVLCVGTVAAVVLVSGVRLWSDFFEKGLPLVNSYVLNRAFNFSVPSLIINMGFLIRRESPAVSAMHEWVFGAGISGLLVVALAYLYCWRWACGTETEFVLLNVAMLAGSLVTWGHYFVFLIFPVAVVCVRDTAQWTRMRAVVFVLILLMLNSLDLGAKPFLEHHLALKFLANYVPLLGLGGLGLFAALKLRVAKTDSRGLGGDVPGRHEEGS